MIINPETLLNSSVNHVVPKEFENIDKQYQSLSLRLEALGGIIFASDEEKQSYLCGVAVGYKELEVEKKIVGPKLKRSNIDGDIPVVDQFYKNEYKFFRRVKQRNIKKRGVLRHQINKKIARTAREDSEYFHKARRQIQSGLIPTPYYLGMSMIHDFVVNKTAKPTR